jgi:hydrogenase/urease accessory protein HupE
VAFLALVDYLRHRGRVRLDVVLMLVSLGIPVLIQFLPDSIDNRRWISTFTGIAIIAQPYLLLRLVEDFRPVPWPYVWTAIAGMVLSWVALIVFPDQMPQAVTLTIIAYFVLVEGYATFVFLRRMLATGGPTRWRLGFAAGGSGLLAIIILLVGINNLVPGVEGVLERTIPFLPVIAGVCYYLGFALRAG